MEQQIQSSFERHEKKYKISEKQMETLIRYLSNYMLLDSFGNYTISSIYFDTDDYALVRASIEKPKYKEKLRLRSYGVPKSCDPVFVEIKKKYDGVVYKRRVKMPYHDAFNYLCNGKQPEQSNQILHEIDWFLQLYQPVPKAFIAYDRTALTGIENHALRVTFDKNIRWRSTALELSQGDWGSQLLQPGEILMEIKLPGACPLWLSHLLSQLQIYPTSFSKYGFCYQQYLIHDFLRKGVFICA